MSEPFIAEIRIFAGNFAPRGWAFCDGQLLPISQNTALFSLIGTIYGGDGRTTTGLPDLKGRAPMHAGNGAGLSTRQLGESGGTETVTLTINHLPLHTHSLQASTGATDEEGSTNPSNAATGVPEPANALYRNPSNLAPMASGVIQSDGGNGSHNNMQPFLALNFIIAMVGLYPSRA